MGRVRPRPRGKATSLTFASPPTCGKHREEKEKARTSFALPAVLAGQGATIGVGVAGKPGRETAAEAARAGYGRALATPETAVAVGLASALTLVAPAAQRRDASFVEGLCARTPGVPQATAQAAAVAAARATAIAPAAIVVVGARVIDRSAAGGIDGDLAYRAVLADVRGCGARAGAAATGVARRGERKQSNRETGNAQTHRCKS
jgi:hypothetical protein